MWLRPGPVLPLCWKTFWCQKVLQVQRRGIRISFLRALGRVVCLAICCSAPATKLKCILNVTFRSHIPKSSNYLFAVWLWTRSFSMPEKRWGFFMKDWISTWHGFKWRFGNLTRFLGIVLELSKKQLLDTLWCSRPFWHVNLRNVIVY